MKLRVRQIKSSNQRPADQKDFLGDVEHFELLDDTTESWRWIQSYVEQGDKVVITRKLLS